MYHKISYKFYFTNIFQAKLADIFTTRFKHIALTRHTAGARIQVAAVVGERC